MEGSLVAALGIRAVPAASGRVPAATMVREELRETAVDGT